jgi:hypothetical protein
LQKALWPRTLCPGDGAKGMSLDWFLDHLDRMCAGLCIAVVGVAASQVMPFSSQYIARTNADLQQAETRVNDINTGVRYQALAEVVRGELLTQATSQAESARRAHNALADRTPLVFPWALWRWADPTVRAAVWASYTPRVPVEPWAIAFTVLGAWIAYALYEILKWPVVAVLRAPRRRFKKRGGLL